MTIYLCSTTVIPAGAYGTWQVQPLTLEDARIIAQELDFVSAVGHASTAEVMTSLLEVGVYMNRLNIQPKHGDYFICFKLDSRPPEGAILDRETLEGLGYSFVIMLYHETGSCRLIPA